MGNFIMEGGTRLSTPESIIQTHTLTHTTPTRYYVFHNMQLEELCPWNSGAKYLYIYIYNTYVNYTCRYMSRLNI